MSENFTAIESITIPNKLTSAKKLAQDQENIGKNLDSPAKNIKTRCDLQTTKEEDVGLYFVSSGDYIRELVQHV